MKNAGLLAGLFLVFFVAFLQTKNSVRVNSSDSFIGSTLAPVLARVIPPKPLAPEAVSPDKPILTPALISEEAARMNAIDPTPEQTQQKLEKMAEKFTANDHSLLKNTVLNSEATENERSLAIYLLTLDPNTPAAVFVEIASMQDPVFKIKSFAHMDAQEHHSFAVTSLAITALDELQMRVAMQPELAAQISLVSKTSESLVVRKTAALMLRSLKKGKLFMATVTEEAH